MFVPAPALDLLLTVTRTGQTGDLAADASGLECWNRRLDAAMDPDSTEGAASTDVAPTHRERRPAGRHAGAGEVADETADRRRCEPQETGSDCPLPSAPTVESAIDALLVPPDAIEPMPMPMPEAAPPLEPALPPAGEQEDVEQPVASSGQAAAPVRTDDAATPVMPPAEGAGRTARADALFGRPDRLRGPHAGSLFGERERGVAGDRGVDPDEIEALLKRVLSGVRDAGSAPSTAPPTHEQGAEIEGRPEVASGENAATVDDSAMPEAARTARAVDSPAEQSTRADLGRLLGRIERLVFGQSVPANTGEKTATTVESTARVAPTAIDTGSPDTDGNIPASPPDDEQPRRPFGPRPADEAPRVPAPARAEGETEGAAAGDARRSAVPERIERLIVALRDRLGTLPEGATPAARPPQGSDRQDPAPDGTVTDRIERLLRRLESGEVRWETPKVESAGEAHGRAAASARTGARPGGDIETMVRDLQSHWLSEKVARFRADDPGAASFRTGQASAVARLGASGESTPPDRATHRAPAPATETAPERAADPPRSASADRGASERAETAASAASRTARPVTAPARVTATHATEPSHGGFHPWTGSTVASGPSVGSVNAAAGADPSRWVEAIVARARNLQDNGSVQLRFALQPEELGPVHVRIDSRGDELRVRIVVSSATAADALQAGLPRLISHLHDAGIRDPQIDLLMDQTGADHPDARRQTAGSGSRDAARFASRMANTAAAAVAPSSSGWPTGARTLLDRMA